MGNLFITELRVSHFLDAVVHLADYQYEEIKIFVKENREIETFYMEGNSEKVHHCRLRFIVTLKIEILYT